MRARMVLAVMVVGLFVVGAPSGADESSFDDAAGDNLFGQPAAALDISNVSVRHEYVRGADNRAGILHHRVETYDEWPDSLITEGPGHLSLVIQARDESFSIGIEANPDGSLYGRITTGGRDLEVAGYARVWRTDASSIDIAFPQSVVDRGARPLYDYGWYVRTSDQRCSYHPGGDVIVECQDFSPDTGSHRHVVAECDDGVDNDEDGAADDADGACFWYGQPSEDRVSVTARLTIERGKRPGFLKGRLIVPPVIDDAGERHDVPFDACREGRHISLQGMFRGKLASFGGATTDEEGFWRARIRSNVRVWAEAWPGGHYLDDRAGDLLTCETDRTRSVRTR